MDSFHQILLDWYHQQKRNLPWHNTKNPYLIWLSEVILQQTRVNQGLSYYVRFASTWPDVSSLAASHEDEVLKMWQGLGYYSRARNLHEAAKQIVEKYDGLFPSDMDELLNIKGIGEYTAAAIASIAFGKAVAVVDGNVYRVLSRLFAVETPVNGKGAKEVFASLAAEMLYTADPGTYNQAIMEFGALQCVPKKPNCPKCPLNARCLAFSRKQSAYFPVKIPKKNVTERFFNYLIILTKDSPINKVHIRKRHGNDIWKGLFEFPLIETTGLCSFNELSTMDQWKRLTGNQKYLFLGQSTTYKHRLTHRLIHARFFIIQTDKKLDLANDFNLSLVDQNELGKYAFPRLIDKFLIETDGLNKVIN